MKTIICLLIVCIAFINAQNGITNTLGTSDATTHFDVLNSNDKILFSVQGSGRVGIGTNSPKARLHVDGNRGVLFTGTLGSGTIPIEGSGTRMMWYPKTAAFRVGWVDGTQWDDGNIGNYSVAMGINTTASGPFSTAMGAETTASGIFSTAMGDRTTASGSHSTAMGREIKASGDYSVAIALNDQNGTNVTENNKMAIMGGFVGIGTIAPRARLHVDNRIRIGKDPTYPSVFGEIFHQGGSNGFKINANAAGGWADMHLQTDGNTRLFIESGGNIGIGTTSPTKMLYVQGSSGGTQVWSSSDFRYKKNIDTIQNALSGVKHLRGVTYEWKNQSTNESTGFDDKVHYGLIAQEVEETIPELVDNVGETKLMKHIEYNGLIGILIEAIKDQQQMIDDLNLRLESVESEG